MNRCLHFLLCLLCLSCSLAQAADTVRIKLIAFNDFHGHLEASRMTVRAPDLNDPSRDISVPAGGAAEMATLIGQLRAQNTNHAVLSAGDMIGASPLTSSLFMDEPTIEVMNRIGLDFHAVGNHEFDKGIAELKRKQSGGCGPGATGSGVIKPCQAGHVFPGANFPFLAANVVDTATGKTLFPAYGIKTFAGLKAAFIGLTLRGTPSITTPANVRGYRFDDEAATINALIPELKAQGVKLFVAVIHQGAAMAGRLNDPRCMELNGPILKIIDRLDPAISVVISGHTHQAYACHYKGVLLTSAGSYSRLVTNIDLEVERTSGRVLNKTATNQIVVSQMDDRAALPSGYAALPKEPVVDALVQSYAAKVKPLAERQVGQISQSLTQAGNPAGESALGRVVADAQLSATRTAGAQIAFMNPGGIRAGLERGSDGRITYADIFTAQPFNNALVTLSMTGAQIKSVLEQQFSAHRQRPLILQVSQGLRYAYDLRRRAGDRVVPGSLKLEGMPLDPAQTYRVTVNDYLASGGDGFKVFNEAAQAQEPVFGMQDVDALEAWMHQHSPITVDTDLRIKKME